MAVASFIVMISSISLAQADALPIVQMPVSFGYQVPTTPRTIDTIIVHATYSPGVSDQNITTAMAEWKADGVSPHYAIDRAGTIYQLVPEADIAWHAGIGTLPNGDTKVNDRSVGIEMIYNITDTPSIAQYASLQALIKNIESRHKITYVLGHEQISPGRKIDPWNFDFTNINDVFMPALSAFPLPVIVSSKVFHSGSKALSTSQQAVMRQYSYRKGCPVPLSDLRVVSVSYYDFNGKVRQGRLVVNKSATLIVMLAFHNLFNLKFPIRQIEPIDAYQGMDEDSIAADNTSAFNCRIVAGTTIYSEHSYGTAIDINPRENPSTTATTPLDQTVQGALTATAVQAVTSTGLKWGGNWTTKKDYQHFSLSGK
jgi:N-acetyl-anhydromuramyl-L-alanine amidase AmpD